MTNPFIPPPEPGLPQQDDGFLHQAGDIAAAPFRGAVGFAQGIYGLADTLTGDALTDWRDNPLGESDTIAGGLVQGATQFMLGFVPVVGIGKWGGLLAKAGWAAEEALGATNIARGLVGGAIADMAVWQGHQNRLSNLVQSIPALQNPVSEFLANDPNDPELLGRLKNAIEGAGLGAAAEGVFAGIRKMGIFGKTRADLMAKITEDPVPQAKLDAVNAEAMKAADAAVPDAEIKAHYDRVNEQNNPFVPKAPPTYPVTEEGVSRAMMDNPKGFTMDVKTGRLLSVEDAGNKWAAAEPSVKTEAGPVVAENSVVSSIDLKFPGRTGTGADNALANAKKTGATHLGGWLDPDTGEYHLNPVRLFDSADEAIAWSKSQYNVPSKDSLKVGQIVPEERTVYNLGTGQTIEVATGIEHPGMGVPAKPSKSGNTQAAGTVLAKTVVKDETGDLLPMFHATRGDFPTEEFRAGSHFGSKIASEDLGRQRFHAMDPEHPAAKNSLGANTRQVYLDIRNPLEVSDHGANSLSSLLQDIDHLDNVDALHAELFKLSAKTDKIPDAIPILKKYGFDGLVYKNEAEDVGRDSYVIFDKSQVHSQFAVDAAAQAERNKVFGAAGRAQAIDTAVPAEQQAAAVEAAGKPPEAAGTPPGQPPATPPTAGASPAGEPGGTPGATPGAAPVGGSSNLPPVTAKTVLGHVLAQNMANLAKYGNDPEMIQKVVALIDEIQTRHTAIGQPTVGLNPRDLSGPELLMLALPKNGINLERVKGSEDLFGLYRAAAELFDAADSGWVAEAKTEQSLKMQNAEGLSLLADAVAADSPDELFARLGASLQDTAQSARKLSARIHAARWVVNTMGQGVIDGMDRLPKIMRGEIDGNLKLERLIVQQNIVRFAQAQSLLSGIKSEVGRALGGMRSVVGSLDVDLRHFADRPELLDSFLEQSGGEKNVAKLLDRMRALYGNGGPEGMASFGRMASNLNKSFGRRVFNAFLEGWMGALLSGPKTAAVNAAGPLAFSYFRPMEALVGSALVGAKANLSGDAARAAAQSQASREAIGQFAELTSGFKEAFLAAKRLGSDHPDVFDGRPGSSVMEGAARRKAITSENFPELEQGGLVARVVDWVGKAARIPTNVLGTTDNIIKTMNYRAAARGRLYAQLAGQPGMTAEHLATAVEDTMSRLIWDHELYSKNQLFRRGLAEADSKGLQTAAERANYATEFVNRMVEAHPEDQALSDFAKGQGWESTLTTPAQPGSLSKGLQGLVGSQPWMRLILPFINTPINIAKAAGQRLDVPGVARYLAGQVIDPKYVGLNNSKNKFISQMMTGDARQQAEAVGRIATGMAAVATVYELVGAGMITGRGPSDPAHRKTMQDAGWQEYSVRVGDSYVSYSRMDPLASIIGTIADTFEYAQYAPMDDGEGASMSMALAMAMANNLTNKTYVAGLANFVDAARAPDKNLASFFQRYAGSMVPNVLGQAVYTAEGDPVMKDVNGMLDAIRAKVPGLSADLPPMRNALGEPMTRNMSLGGRATDWWLPVGYREFTDDPIKLAMAQTGHGFGPPKSTWEGRDLNAIKVGNTTAYDRWGELQGTVNIGGMRIRDALRKLIATPEFQKSTAAAIGETQSPRVNMINNVIYRYRDAAWRQLLRESPELAAYSQSVLSNKLSARRGDLFSLER